ncbi:MULTISPECIES: hypothetical protein [Pandoraea]|uniref:Uncharacterized protein n=2 Tax=Pandoraea TaxID=93217 RepID=A0A5E4XDJ9_9BURK|nr:MULTISPECIES: hypothetical protein [Pandoraea]VVE16653.1 hypothetical protein PCE31107_02930 [Pandoraea cepalis]VVE34481.1 hypothetical protein PTE31013_03851 [Pandoraea terrigena]
MSNWNNLPLRKNDISRSGYGHKKGRFALLSWASLIFCALVARRAIKLGRNVVVTGTPDSGANTVLTLISGKTLGPNANPGGGKTTYSPSLEDLEGTHALKFIGPRSFDPNAWRTIMQHLGERGRPFSIATVSRHADWLRHELDLYAASSNARGIFWLTLK